MPFGRRADGNDGRLIAGVELGGTKCVCLLAYGPEAIVDRVTVPTRDPAATLAVIAEVLGRWRAAHDVAALGIAAFGPLELDPASPDYGRMLGTPKPGWAGADIVRALAIGVPTIIDTDVGGAAAAEGRWGAARGLASHAYVTVGTGVGVGIVIGGRRLRGFGHPEPGHAHVQRAPGDTWPGACVYHGACVEGLASGVAIDRRVGRSAEALAPDDPLWEIVAHTLAGLAHNLFMTVAPHRILIGGTVALRQPQLLPLIRRFLNTSLAGYGAASRLSLEDYIRAPALGGDAGPLGAIALGLEAIC